jgi:hypothetical protein
MPGEDSPTGKPLGVGDGLREPRLETHNPEGTYIAMILVQDRREVPVRAMHTTCRDQTLTEGSAMAQCEPVTPVTPLDAAEPKTQDTIPQLQDKEGSMDAVKTGRSGNPSTTLTYHSRGRSQMPPGRPLRKEMATCL